MLFAVNQNTGKQVFLGSIQSCFDKFVYIWVMPTSNANLGQTFTHKFWLGAFTCFGYKLVMVCPD